MELLKLQGIRLIIASVGRLPGKPGFKNFQFLIFIALSVWGFALRYMPYKCLKAFTHPEVHLADMVVATAG